MLQFPVRFQSLAKYVRSCFLRCAKDLGGTVELECAIVQMLLKMAMQKGLNSALGLRVAIKALQPLL
jgi:hypothetical protein